MRITSRAVLAAASLFLCPDPALAQIYEAVGTRAQGMAGAFTAIADDATATWWNSAGIAGQTFSATVQQTWIQQPRHVPAAGPAWRDATTGVALTIPSLGLSYYRIRISEIAPTTPATAAGGPGREDGTGGVRLRTLVTSQFGATVGQSVGDHLVIASTLKLVHGGSAVAVGQGANGSEALDLAARLDASGETHADLDLGALATVGPLRAGVSVKHLRRPSFGDGDARFELTRQARAGVAVTGTTRGILAAATAAVDADLTSTRTSTGEMRHLAVGGEAWLFGKRVGLRGGASFSTLGDVRPSGSAGASLAIRSGLSVDAAVNAGADESLRGWGVGLRVGF